MTAYVIADIDVHDAEAYREYVALVPGTIEPFGGRFIVRGGDHQSFEGEWRPHRLVVIEFPSADDARRWYASDATSPRWRSASAPPRAVLSWLRAPAKRAGSAAVPACTGLAGDCPRSVTLSDIRRKEWQHGLSQPGSGGRMFCERPGELSEGGQ